MPTAIKKTDKEDENKTDEFDAKLKVFKKYEKPTRVRGQIIVKLASEFYYVDKNALIKDIVNDFNVLAKNRVVGVVDAKQKIVGLIERKKLFNLLGKPFGRDILENKTINEVRENETLKELISNVEYFYVERNIFSVVNEIKDSLDSKDLVYFLLAKGDKHFAGIFTNIDVLFYLSSITQADLKVAQQLQSNIVQKKKVLNEKTFKIVAASNAAKGVGGDFYLVKKTNKKKWIISLCDVSGKGVSAALVTSLLGGLFNIYNFDDGISNFIKKTNEYILQSFNMEKYLTGVFMKFDEETGKVKLFDMGHAYIYVYRNKSLYRFKSHENNVPLGFLPDIDPISNQFTLQENDILFCLTDGINEQPNSEGKEYGLNRVLEIIEKNRGNNFEDIVDILKSDIDNFRGYYPQHDDMTILLLKYTGVQE